MIDQIVAFIVAENKWLTISLGAALMAVGTLLVRDLCSATPVKHRVMTAMHLFFGVTIGTMAFGHLLAVTTKLAMGTLEGPTVVFYAIGVALAVPSWWLIVHTGGALEAGSDHTALRLNIALAVVLFALGPRNLPLAAPALFNVAYQRHRRPAIGWAIVSVAVMVYVGLFIGSLIFWASGQSFEQFSGME